MRPSVDNEVDSFFGTIQGGVVNPVIKPVGAVGRFQESFVKERQGIFTIIDTVRSQCVPASKSVRYKSKKNIKRAGRWRYKEIESI